MRHKKIITVITTFALASQMLTAVIFGQTVSTNGQSQNVSKTNYSSRYLQDIAQLINSPYAVLVLNPRKRALE